MYRIVTRPNLSGLCRCFSRTLVSVDTVNDHEKAIPLSKEQTNVMKAWQFDETSGSSQPQCNDGIPIPAVRCPTDVLVEVHAASINPLDVAMLKGYGSRVFDTMRCLESTLVNRYSSHMLITGRDFSGVVRELGSSAKSRFRPGDEVIGVIGPHKQGSHSKLVLASSYVLTKKPSRLSHVEAASLPYAGLTAWSSLRCFGGVWRKQYRGQSGNIAATTIFLGLQYTETTALVFGGSGGVGTIAIQLLKAWGFQVTTVVNADAIPLVESLGADQVVDYSQPEWEKLLGQTEKYNLILNCTNNLSSTYGLDLLKPWHNSKYVHTMSPLLRNIDAHGWPLGLFQSATEFGFDAIKGACNGKFYSWAYALPIKRGLEEIVGLADIGKIKPVVQRVFSFDQLPLALETFQKGHARGKTVIDYKAQ